MTLKGELCMLNAKRKTRQPQIENLQLARIAIVLFWAE
jgi:hypothetical protein